MAKLRVTNQCRIPLNWHVELYTDLLRVIDGPEILQPLSDGLITVERLATPPGYFNEKLFLEVTGKLKFSSSLLIKFDSFRSRTWNRSSFT